MFSVFIWVYVKEYCNLLLHVMSPTCQEVLNSSNQRFPISRSDKIGFCLGGEKDCAHSQHSIFYEQELLETNHQKGL